MRTLCSMNVLTIQLLAKLVKNMYAFTNFIIVQIIMKEAIKFIIRCICKTKRYLGSSPDEAL